MASCCRVPRWMQAAGQLIASTPCGRPHLTDPEGRSVAAIALGVVLSSYQGPLSKVPCLFLLGHRRWLLSH